jgi:hypothetical protein
MTVILYLYNKSLIDNKYYVEHEYISKIDNMKELIETLNFIIERDSPSSLTIKIMNDNSLSENKMNLSHHLKYIYTDENYIDLDLSTSYIEYSYKNKSINQKEKLGSSGEKFYFYPISDEKMKKIMDSIDFQPEW